MDMLTRLVCTHQAVAITHKTTKVIDVEVKAQMCKIDVKECSKYWKTFFTMKNKNKIETSILGKKSDFRFRDFVFKMFDIFSRFSDFEIVFEIFDILQIKKKTRFFRFSDFFNFLEIFRFQIFLEIRFFSNFEIFRIVNI